MFPWFWGSKGSWWFQASWNILYSIKFHHFCKARGKNKTYLRQPQLQKGIALGACFPLWHWLAFFCESFVRKIPQFHGAMRVDSAACRVSEFQHKNSIRMGGFSIQRCLFQSSHFWSSIWLWFTKVLYWSNVTSASQYHGSCTIYFKAKRTPTYS